MQNIFFSKGEKMQEVMKAVLPYTLKDISSVRSYDYDKPTICHDYFIERKQWTEPSTFADNFFKLYPYLKNNIHDLIIFGGCIIDLFLGRSHDTKDIDFVYYVEKQSEIQISIS